MASFSFIHAADIHLDSPLLNLDRYDGAPVDEFRGAVRGALAGLVDLAIAEHVRFVLIAGDLYDTDCRDFNTPRFLRTKMAELGAAGIDVCIIQGNHDARSRMDKAFRLHLPANVHVFPADAASTLVIDDVDVAIHGQSYAERSVTDDLSLHYPPARAQLLNIGLLHSEIGGGEGDYAPSTVATLIGKGYDYWALGHIHDRKVLRQGDPWILYPGVLQGRHIAETGAKGCTLVRVEGGCIAAVEERAVDVVRWQRATIDAHDCDHGEAVMAKCERAIAALLDQSGDRKLATRVEVVGPSSAHTELSAHPSHWASELRERVVDRFDDRVWVEKVILSTSPAFDIALMLASDDPISELIRELRRPDSLAAALATIRPDLDKLLDRLPSDARLAATDAPPIDLDDPLQLDDLVDDIERLLVPRLLAAGESQ